MLAELSWTDLAGPLVLFFMMAVVGCQLGVEDFRRIGRCPRVVVVATAAQWTLLPLLAIAPIVLFDLEPHIAAGLVLLTAAPGGGTSNVITYLAGAHTALSVTLTAITSLCAALTLPLITAGGFAFFLGQEGLDQMPVVPMIAQLVLFVLVPLGLGMRIRSRRPELAERYATPLRRAVLTALVVLMVLAMSTDDSGLLGEMVYALPAAAIWTVAAFLGGWWTGACLRLSTVDRFTIATEFSVKNVGLAAIVALAGFGRPELAVFSGAYLTVGYPMAAAAALCFHRIQNPRPATSLG